MGDIEKLREFANGIDRQKYVQVHHEDIIIELKAHKPEYVKSFTYEIPDTNGSCTVIYITRTLMNHIMVYHQFKNSMDFKMYLDLLED